MLVWFQGMFGFELEIRECLHFKVFNITGLLFSGNLCQTLRLIEDLWQGFGVQGWI